MCSSGKRCMGCRAVKSISKFSTDNSQPDHHCVYCNDCMATYRVGRRYRSQRENDGMTIPTDVELESMNSITAIRQELIARYGLECIEALQSMMCGDRVQMAPGTYHYDSHFMEDAPNERT